MKKLFILLSLILFCLSAFTQNTKSTKRGIAYGYHSEADMAVISEGLSWWYNWYHQPESGVANVYQNYDMDFVPMTWNNGFNEAALRSFYTNHPEAKYLLGFNEPNFTDQANMKPSQVAAAWPRLEAIATDFDLEIVGPAVNYCGNCVSEGGVVFTNPYAYLDSFFSACPGCKVDYIAIHNYMCYTGALSGYIEGFKKYGKKIWLTEYACWDQNNITLAMQKNLMKGSIDYLENDTMVFRYAWFTGSRSGAYPYLDIYDAQSGKLTELGEFYVSYRAFVPDTSFYALVPDRIEAEHYTQMFGISTETVSDFDGVDNVGWIDANDWLEYNIDVPSDGEYYIYFRIAGTRNSSIYIKIDGQNTDTLNVSSSGGWQNWRSLALPVDLPAGKHKLMIFTPNGGFNLNWIRISDHMNTAPVINAGDDQAINLPENSIILNSTVEDPDADVIQYKWTKTGGPASFNITEPTKASTEVSGLVKGLYTFKLEVSDGTELDSDQVVVEVLSGVGFTNYASGKNRIYPNPADNMLTIEQKGHKGKIAYAVMDQAGRIIIDISVDGTSEVYELDLSPFKPGYYILKITCDSDTSFYSFIKL